MTGETHATGQPRAGLLRSILAVALFPLVGFVASLGYMLLLGRGLGRNDWALVAAPIVLPMFVLVCGVAWLVALYAWEALAGPRPSDLGPVALSAAVALVFGLVVAGPRGFTLAGGSELVNVYLLIVVPIGALLYRRGQQMNRGS